MKMGRKSTVNTNLPPNMRSRVKKGHTYYSYDLGGKPRKEIQLGKDYVLALQKWTELQKQPLPKGIVITFKMACNKYREEVMPDMPAGTQKDYNKAINQLLKYFDNPPAPLDAIEAKHVRAYLDMRGKQATTRANRERSVISTIWNHAREWGYTNNINPCQGVKGFKETVRSVYIEDKVYQAVYAEADQPTKDALDLAYLTAQRPADVTKMYETDIQGDRLAVKQNKTDVKIKISIQGELKDLLDRIDARKKAYKVRSLALIVDETGKKLSQRAIWERFNKARKLAADNNPKLRAEIEEYQIRDLRAKGGTDKAIETNDIRKAQELLGHSNVTMTERYIRKRIGHFVEPTK